MVAKQVGPVGDSIRVLEMQGDSPPGFPTMLLSCDVSDEESDDILLGKSRLRVEGGIAS